MNYYNFLKTNILTTNLKTVDVRMDWVEKIRAWVYQIPFLKSIHFNFISKISRQTLEFFTYFLSYLEILSQLFVYTFYIYSSANKTEVITV